ncbi:acid protease [Russula aff. rugulosa BPL654]|nr:acid protease [Russula aff. rugulosa BPL654]
MLLVTALVSFVVLAARVAADPSNHHPHSHSLSITKHIDHNAKYNLVQRDRRRFTHLMKKANPVNSSSLVVEDSETAELPLINTGPCYVANVGIGEPPTLYNLIIDTGSSITWVGVNTQYVKTKTSVNTSEEVAVNYGSGSFFGRLFKDTVTIAPGVSASEQPIGVALSTSGMFPVTGSWGELKHLIGPRDLTFGTLSYPRNASTIATVTDSLFAQRAIERHLVAVSFEPTTSGSDVNGELTFGAIDPTKYIGDITYSPITKNPRAGKYWGIDASIRYGSGQGGASVGLTNTTAGIVDTGTTLVYLSTDAYNQYAEATGGVLDSQTNLLRITEAQYKNLQSLYFHINDETFELTANAQIWRREHNTAIQGDTDSIYLAVQDIVNVNPGLGFLCGMAFLERFYTVFDTGKHRIGLARTPFTNATTN